MYICRIQTIRQSHPSADGSVKLYRWAHESPLARKRESCRHNHEKYWEVRTYSPKFPHTLIKLLISQVLEHPCHIPALNLPSEKPSSCRILCVAWECRYLLLLNPGISFGTMWQDLRHLGTAASYVWSLQNVSMQCMIKLQPSLQRLHRRGGKEQYHCTILKLPDTIAGASILCGDCSPLWYLASCGNLEEKIQGGSSIQPSCEYQHHLTHWPASWIIMNKSYFTDPGWS